MKSPQSCVCIEYIIRACIKQLNQYISQHWNFLQWPCNCMQEAILPKYILTLEHSFRAIFYQDNTQLYFFQNKNTQLFSSVKLIRKVSANIYFILHIFQLASAQSLLTFLTWDALSIHSYITTLGPLFMFVFICKLHCINVTSNQVIY